MPRDPKVQLRAKCQAAWRNHERSVALVEATRKKLDESILAAVRGGITRYELATMMGKSPTFIAKTPGLEPNRSIPKKGGAK